MNNGLTLLYGKPIADQILATAKKKAKKLKRRPRLVVIVIGDSASSIQYIKTKQRCAQEIGVTVDVVAFDKDVRTNDVVNKIKDIENDADGIMVQVPLPRHINLDAIINVIPDRKNVDGLRQHDVDLKHAGASQFLPVFPVALAQFVDYAGIDVINQKTLVITNSDIFARIISSILVSKGLCVRILIAKDVSERAIVHAVGQSEIVVSAVGSAGMLKGYMFQRNALVIDGGVTVVNKQTYGDVDRKSCDDLELKLTPVPGGVGPVTVAILLGNVVTAMCCNKSH